MYVHHPRLTLPPFGVNLFQRGRGPRGVELLDDEHRNRKHPSPPRLQDTKKKNRRVRCMLTRRRPECLLCGNKHIRSPPDWTCQMARRVHHLLAYCVNSMRVSCKLLHSTALGTDNSIRTPSRTIGPVRTALGMGCVPPRWSSGHDTILSNDGSWST